MKRPSILLLFILALFVTGLAAVVRADPKSVVIRGVDDDSELGEWLDDVIVKRYDEAEEQRESQSLKRDVIRALEAKGYYEPKVEIIEGDNLPPEARIQTGPRYTVGSIAIAGVTGHEIRTLEVGEPLDAISVLETQRNFAEDLQADGCYYDLDVSHKVVLNEKTNTGAITFVADAGPKATFGTVTFEGAPNISRRHLNRFVTFEPETCWHQSEIEETKEALLETGLLAIVREDLPDSPDANGRVDVVFNLTERAPRSVRLGVSYYTDEGPGLVASWIHRNFRGEGEVLEASMRTNFLEQSLSADYAKPYFFNDEDLAHNLYTRLAHEDTDAFDTKSLNVGASVDVRFDEYVKGTFGTTFELSRIEDKNSGEENDFGLYSVYGQFTFDNRDDPLNPTRGFLLRARAEPFFDVLGESSPFFKSSIAANTYFAFDEDRDLILALRGRLGSITGAAVDDVPATKRFYAGGSGSIRGFGFQEASPFENGDPSGGRSLIETSTELRYRFKENMGAVVFVDAGGAYESSYPDFDEGLYVGAGVGFRYYTGFGPLRFDVAVPVNKSDQASSAFQLYASIGQAF